MDGIHLTTEEVHHLVLSIWDGIAAAEDHQIVRSSWPSEMRDWCDMLVGRLSDE
jgi:hypothetical protein